MDVMERMSAHREHFTPNDQLIYQRIASSPESVASLTTSVLAEQCGVSQPALTRFVKAIGYERYQDFRTDLVAWLTARNARRPREEGHLPYFGVVHRELAELELLLTDDYLQDLATYINSFERVFATGVTKSFHPAQLLQQLTIKTARHIDAFEIGLIDEICDALGSHDLIIAFTLSQRNPLWQVLESTEAKLLLVTATPAGPLSRLADRQVVFPTVAANAEESAISPVMFDAFAEILVSYLARGHRN